MTRENRLARYVVVALSALALNGCVGEGSVIGDAESFDEAALRRLPATLAFAPSPAAANGAVVQITGSGFKTGIAVRLTAGDPAAELSATPDATGAIALSLTTGAPGLFRYKAYQFNGKRDVLMAQATLEVLAPCGDGVCAGGESCSSCAVDCGVCPPICGNNLCEAGEACDNCATDCGACGPVCGDAVCDSTETCSSCPGDCGACPPVCGNRQCEAGETCSSCSTDCGACPAVCGNRVCESGETCSSCPGDCGACGPVCGNMTCESGETCSSCPGDCGACTTCQGGDPAADRDEQEFVTLINAYRQQNGLAPLKLCRSLSRAAQGHSDDMVALGFFSHTGADGSTPWQRACEACYQNACPVRTAMGENIAAGQPTAQSVFDAWKASSGHNANMLGASYTVMGLGKTAGGAYGIYWTNLFAGADEASCN